MSKIVSRLLVFTFVAVIHSFSCKAQDTASVVLTDSLQYQLEKDIVDVAEAILHKEKRGGSHQTRKTHISVVPALGYTLQTGFAGVLSGNIAFHTGSSEDQKLSSILTSLTYSQYKQFIVPLQASIWSKGNKYNIAIDWRYMHYPSKTYGLGGKTALEDGYTIDFFYARFHQSVFTSITKNLYAGIGYYLDYFWGIKELDLPPNTVTVFQKYGLSSTELASGPALRLLYDSRLNQINPDKGLYSNIVFRPNFMFMGSQSNWQSLLLEFRKYIRLPGRSKNVLAFWSYNWLTTGGHPPYLLLPSTGWDDAFNTGRGYIQGRFRGRNMIYLEAEYRFRITNNGLLGGVIFANVQSFSKEIYKALNVIEPAAGAGLRIKLNKHSGANLCIDYGIGLNHSHGFFVNLNEVF